MEVGATYLVLIMCLVQQITAGFGPAAWQLAESNSSNSYITNVRTTMKIPSLPSQQGLLYWPGLYTEDGWLVQSIIGNEVDYLEDFCPGSGTNNQWCAFTYAYHSGVKEAPAAKGAIVNPGDLLDIEYDYDGNNKNTTQTVTYHGKVISKLSVTTGPGYRFEDTIECHGHYDAPVPGQTYINTTIVLATENSDFAKTLYHNGSTPTSVESSDGGKTWSVPQIQIEESTCVSTG